MSAAPNLRIFDELSASANDASRAGRRATVSAVLIVKNEASTIEACLDSVQWADEIIVLDCGSTDRTVEIATERGAKVHIRADWQGFGIQRQRAQQLATCDYIFSIDADERVSQELRHSIERVLAEPDDSKVYKVVMREFFLGGLRDTRSWHRTTHVRLYARRRYSFNSNMVHESLDTRGAAKVVLSGSLLHYTCLDFQYFQHKRVAYAHDWARPRAQRGERSSLKMAIVRAVWMFTRIYLLDGRFLDGAYGFLYAWNLGQYTFNKYAALWHYSHNQSSFECEIERPAVLDQAA